MVVKDVKEFHTCGLLEHENKAKPEIRLNQDAIHIKYETNVGDNDREQYEGEDISEETIPAPRQYHTQTQLLHRSKRSIDTTLTKEGILHGKTNETNDSSESSFEKTLISCHDGRILLNSNFTVSHLCTNNEFLANGSYLQIRHDILENGYYFYIFYSDNDLESNEVHAIFDVVKPTYENNGNIPSCLNKTQCSFSIGLFSKETVIVEIPMRNGIEHEKDDHMIMISTCKPRTAVYSVFPIAVLFLILLSAFMGSGTNGS